MTLECLQDAGGPTGAADDAAALDRAAPLDRAAADEYGVAVERTGTPQSPGAVDDEVAARLRLALAQVARELRRTVGQSSLTQTEAALLGTIARQGPVRVQDLARAEGLNQTMVSRLVVDLERRGELVRRRDPADRRLVWVELTASGNLLYAELRATRARVLASALERLDEPTRVQIVAATAALESLAAELRSSGPTARRGSNQAREPRASSSPNSAGPGAAPAP